MAFNDNSSVLSAYCVSGQNAIQFQANLSLLLMILQHDIGMSIGEHHLITSFQTNGLLEFCITFNNSYGPIHL